MKLELNRDDAESFLSALDPTATFFTFQAFDDNYSRKDGALTRIWHGTLGQLWDQLANLNRRGAGIFVTVNATDGEGRAARNIKRVRALFVDLDGAPLPEKFHVPPHIINESSPGKWHIYWLVTKCSPDQFEALQRRLIRHYGGDPKIVDTARVMRMPGFVHHKVDKHGNASVPSVTRLDRAHDHDLYAVEQVPEGLPEVEETKPSGDGATARGNGSDADPNWFERYGDSQSKSGRTDWTPAEEAKLRSALDAIPTDEEILNEELGDSHMVWLSIGRALERLGWSQRGYKMWRDWCRGSTDKFDEKGLRAQWRSFQRTRDSGTKKITFRTIYHYAKVFGWQYREPRAEAEPTYTDDATTSAARARAELEQLMEAFLDAEPNWWEKYGGIARFVHAVQATTGIGKTRIAARVIARRIKSGRLTGPVGYAVPTHRLGEDIAEQFREHGITAEVWRGRKAFISGKSGPTMCEDLGAVKIAEDLGVTIETACCRGKDPTTGRKAQCPFYNHCAYQAQKARKPDVWIFAHQMLFRKNKTLDGLSALFIDESFRDAGTSRPVKGLTIDEIEAVPPCPAGPLGFYREQLAHALRAMPHNGGVPREILREAVFEAEWCTIAIKLEWSTRAKTTLWPGMPAKARAAAAEAGTNIRHTRTFDRVWRAARELLELEGDVVSGRLFVANHRTENGVVRVVRTRSIREIAKQYVVRTFIMDATLPAKSILEKWFPGVEIVSQIEVPMPHVRVRQILGSPITKKKLAGAGRNLRAVRRYVLQRHVEAGRESVLVIAQKDIEAALQATGLPPTVAVEHFNAIGGLDQYKDVRLLITVGRTQPGPEAVEEDAGALSGVEPVKAAVTPNQSRWYDKVTRGIRMRDGTGVAVVCDQHPDPLAEDVRWQVCEGELVQAIGRGRGVNRTAETPLAVDILGDVVLPVTVDEVQEWAAPGLEVEMVAEGIWLESPTDMSKAWPDDWATPMAAKNWLREHTVLFPLIDTYSQGKVHRVRYQHPGERQKWRLAWVDPAVVPDARAWLESRLGPLAGFEITVIRFALKAESFSVGGLDFATPTLTVRPGPGQEKLPWSAPAVEEVTEPALVRQIHAECAGAEERTAVSPHGVPMVWYEVPTEPPEEVPWSSPLVDEVVAVVHKVLDERDARGAPARAARNGQ